MEEKRALVVDDYEDIAEFIAVLLRRNGYAVETASSGAEALEKCQANDCDFDIILSDLAMPGMNGYELARKLKASGRCKRTAMIAVTGLTIYGDRRRALEAGFDDLITKPFGPLSLIAMIERHSKAKAKTSGKRTKRT